MSQLWRDTATAQSAWGGIMNVFEKIESMQKGIENTAPWMVGEQLKDICRREPACADLVLKDLEMQGMGLKDCEKQIKAWADKNKKGNCCCVPPNVAESIIREFYGLPEAKPQETKTQKTEHTGKILDLSAFL